MIRKTSRVAGISYATIALLALSASQAKAQQQPPLMPPEVQLQDENGVDLMSGMVSFSIPTLSIGSGEFKIVRNYEYGEESQTLTTIQPDSLRSGLFASGTSNIVQVGPSTEILRHDGTGWVTYSGGKLAYNGDGTATFTTRDGTIVTVDVSGSSNGATGPTTKIVWPNGKAWNYSYQVVGSPGAKGYTLISITQNNGLQVRYQGNTTTAVNLASEYCAASSTSCSLSQAWPTTTASVANALPGVDTFYDASGQQTSMYRNVDNVLVDVRLPQSGGNSTITYDRCNSSFTGAYKCYWATTDGGIGSLRINPLLDKTISSTRNGTTWNFNFNWNIGCCYAQYEKTGPNGARRIFFYSANNQSWPVWLEDGYGRYNFSNTEASRIISHVWTEGNEEKFTYDSRGNVTQIVFKAKLGSGLPDQTATANYDTTCSNMKTCNKPNWVIDRNGNRTDYQYNSVHGQVTRVISPPVGGVQPITRYYYTERFAWYLGSSGSYIRDPQGVWLLTSSKSCKTGATVADACAIANDEVTVLYDYGPDSGPNNLWLRGEAVQADGQTLWTCYGYDRFGNQISVTKSNAGLTSCS